jgi:hypothetical protein
VSAIYDTHNGVVSWLCLRDRATTMIAISLVVRADVDHGQWITQYVVILTVFNWNSSVVPMVLIKHNVTATAALGCLVVVAGCVSLFAVVVFVITIWLLSFIIWRMNWNMSDIAMDISQ